MVLKDLNDKRAILNILGCVVKTPSLLEHYALTREDFEVEAFHELIFACIYNLYHQGVAVIDCFSIDSFLSAYDAQYEIFNKNNGVAYIADAVELSESENFEYYYHRLKKFSCLRYYEKQGLDTSGIYNPNLLEPKEQEREAEKFDTTTIEDIIGKMETLFVIEPKIRYISKNGVGKVAGEGLQELKESFKKQPEFGAPLASPIITTVTRGARLTKIYMRSSASGGGKTRLSVADMCSLAIPWFYDLSRGEWRYTGWSEPTLFLSTELEIDEIQTLILAYVSGVDEDRILDGTYGEGEEARVDEAIGYIKSSPFYIEFLPDFSIVDIENIIKKYKREKGVLYVSFDYVHSSASLIREVSTMSKGMRMREDMMLFLFIDTLKTLCINLGVFLQTATQLNGTYKDSPIKDETMLRGAKSLADRLDVGIICLPPSKAELTSVAHILRKRVGGKEPNLVQNIYKVRRGKLTRIKVWQHATLGNCRTEDLFVTNNDYELIPVESTTLEALDKLIEDNSIHQSELVLTQAEQEEAATAVFNW